MRRDPVTREVAQQVMARDAAALKRWCPRHVGLCIAPMLDPQAGPCFGRTTLEHVKEALRMGVRAESDPQHLVSLCAGHTEPGMKSGRCWNTTKENRAKVRDYLAPQYPLSKEEEA